MQVDDRRCSFARRRCRGDLQLEVCARLMSATAQLTSRPCQQAVRSALACVGRCSLSLCAVGHRVPPRAHSPGRMSCPEPGSFDQAVSYASEPLPWVGRVDRWRRSLDIPRWGCGLRAAVGSTASICSVTGARALHGSTSPHGRERLMVAASVRVLLGLMASS